MKNRRCLLLLLLACGLAPLCALADGGCLNDSGAPDMPRLTAGDQQLLALFTRAADKRNAPVLQSYLTQSSSANAAILGNYARLRLAAMALRDGDSRYARHQLSQIEQNSPAAVDAALLLADSYRRDGDQQRAQAWLLRIAARFPGNPRAISGLLLAGDDFRQQGNPELALPVYNLALNNAKENLDALEQLQHDPDQLIRTLTNTVAGNSTTVTDQLVLALIRDPHSQALSATRTLLRAHRQKKCLDQQRDALREALQQASARDTTNAAFRTSAEQEKAATQQEIADLQRILKSAPNAGKLEARLSDARDRLSHLNRRLQKLAKTRIPARLEEREKTLRSLQHNLQQGITDARMKIIQALQEQLPALKAYYRNLAGEAQLGKARLLQNNS
ncbi:MAG: hypothetical protein R3292_04755 [Alcanivorax sp.]|nr:hypothetical protein [Alcanivorax sp.]